ncbi:MAG: prolyl-tRNA synthetase, partial [Pseudomonadota bacterium]
MKYSKALIQTSKTASSDETLKSVIYLTKGGFITQVGAGLYDFLPIGQMALDNIKKVIKNELDKADAQEVTLSFVCPYEVWQKSGRAEKYGKELLRFKDRKNADFVLSPTCEELMVEMVKSKVTSWRQLPLNIYQIHLKFRDEIRPRFGLLRGREFWMKDGYSFHESIEDMLREFALMQATYSKIFSRIGLEFKIVEADSGAIGGSGSKEFMVLANAGEDTLTICPSCEYGANIEAAKRKPKKYADELLQTEPLHTPNIKTIDDLSKALNVPKHKFLKAVAKLAVYKEETKPVVFFVSGADELEETKALNACGALSFEDLTEENAVKAGITLGFIGLKTPVEKYIDEELVGRYGMISGADVAD